MPFHPDPQILNEVVFVVDPVVVICNPEMQGKYHVGI